MSNNQKIQKKDDSKKVEEKPEVKKPSTFSAYVSEITPTNQMMYIAQGDKKQQKKIVSLAYVDVPRYNKTEKKEECFAYECGEYLRKKLITGKLVKFEIIKEQLGEVKAVVPIVGKENIIVSLLEKGYVVLKSVMKSIGDNYIKAEKKAKDNKVGIHADNVVELCKKRPENVNMNEVECQAIVGKTVSGYIKKIQAPAVYVIENSERKQFTINLYAVDQMLRRDRDTKKFVFDEDGKEGMEHCRRYFNKRDVTVEVKQALKGNLYGVIRQDKKDIAEDLIANGFVVCKRFEGIPESIKQAYEKAEKEAKKEHRARWTDFDQSIEDKIIAEREERIRKLEERKKNCNVISGAEVKKIEKHIEISKEGKTYHINLASVKFIYRKDEKANDLLLFRIKECIRKQIVGKKFECKEAYREMVQVKDKKYEHIFYDVYAAGKNICQNLFKEGLVTLIKERDEFKRSFDYERFEELQKQGNKYEEKQIKYVEKEDKIKNKDVYLTKQFQCVLERVISPVKYVVYIPEKDIKMVVALKGCRIPRDDDNKELQQFLSEGKKFIYQNVGLNEITVLFEEYQKGEFLCDVSCKKFEFGTQLIKNGYVMFVGKDAPNEEVEQMKETGEKIYKFQTVRKQREEEPKPVVAKPKKEIIKEMKFGEGKKVYITGYDGRNVYYYETVEDCKFLEELSSKMKGVKRTTSVEEKEGVDCIVDVKGKFYRAQIIDPVPKALVVKCIDTGAVVVCGKNKLKPMTSEIKEFVAPKQLQQVALVGLKTPVRGKHVEYEASIAAVAQYYNKEATVYSTTLGESIYAKVMVGEVCLNTMLLTEGLAVLNKNFKDASEWGVQMQAAQELAKEEHHGMWKYGEFFDDEDREQK